VLKIPFFSGQSLIDLPSIAEIIWRSRNVCNHVHSIQNAGVGIVPNRQSTFSFFPRPKQ
jgi:hypothetical protein